MDIGQELLGWDSLQVDEFALLEAELYPSLAQFWQVGQVSYFRGTQLVFGVEIIIQV